MQDFVISSVSEKSQIVVKQKVSCRFAPRNETIFLFRNKIIVRRS